VDGNNQRATVNSNSSMPSRKESNEHNTNQIISHSNAHPNANLKHNSLNGRAVRTHKAHSLSSYSHRTHTTSSSTRTIMHYHMHTGNIFSNKMRNNYGHKASQTKRIQLSSASKRCKSNVNYGDVNTIHVDDICKADDGATVRQINDEVSADNSTQSTASPTLVKVKTWYTQSSIELPQHLA
jgi:hypothetical protein